LLDALNYVDADTALDILCSVGCVLEAAGALGLEAAGTDVSEFAVMSCRRRGFAARQGTMTALAYADDSVAMVAMKHVLEHRADRRRGKAARTAFWLTAARVDRSTSVVA
jgi:2-polyprenyl-3-methyl-5-hydroxy-6-metoxy-1,4-benzoquinol methylase